MTAPTPTVASPAESTLPTALRESMTEFLRESRAPNTRRAYRAALAAFVRFCDEQDRSPMPATPETTAAFLSDEASQGLRPATIAVHASAIAYSHRLAGHPNPCDTVLIRDLLRGIRRTQGVAPRQAPALTLARLAAALVGLDRSSVRGRRDAALLTLGFALAARRSELVALDIQDLEDDGDGLLVRIRRSKTDQEGQGAVLYVPLAGESLEVCAVRAVRAWLVDLGEGASGPLFCAVRKGGALGSRLSERAVDLVVRRAGSVLEGEAPFSAHSLRSGLVTTLAAQGRTEIQIMQQTRHKSSAMIRRYARELNAKRASPLHGMW